MNLTLDFAALDRDVSSAMAGDITFADLYNTWIAPAPVAEHEARARLISERVHDALLAWTR